MAANQDGPKSAENVNEQELVSTDQKGRLPSSKIVGTINFSEISKSKRRNLSLVARRIGPWNPEQGTKIIWFEQKRIPQGRLVR